MSNARNQPLFCLVPNSSNAEDVLTLNENRPYRKGPATRFLDFPYFIFGPSRPSKQAGILAALGSGKEQNDIWLGHDNGNVKGYRERHCVFFVDQSGDLRIRPFAGARVCVVLIDTDQHGYAEVEDDRERRSYLLHAFEGQPIPEMVLPRHPKWEITIGLGRDENTCFRLAWLDVDSQTDSPCWILVDSMPQKQAYGLVQLGQVANGAQETHGYQKMATEP